MKKIEKAIDFIKRLIDLTKQVVSPATAVDEKTGGALSKAANLPLTIAQGIGGIFGMAEGGIVTRPTLAMIGEGNEPEAVIPLSKMGAMGTMNITVNMPAGADGNDVVQALEDYVRRNGSIPLAVNNLVRK